MMKLVGVVGVEPTSHLDGAFYLINQTPCHALSERKPCCKRVDVVDAKMRFEFVHYARSLKGEEHFYFSWVVSPVQREAVLCLCCHNFIYLYC